MKKILLALSLITCGTCYADIAIINKINNPIKITYRACTVTEAEQSCNDPVETAISSADNGGNIIVPASNDAGIFSVVIDKVVYPDGNPGATYAMVCGANDTQSLTLDVSGKIITCNKGNTFALPLEDVRK
jgi:hypothetical protein